MLDSIGQAPIPENTRRAIRVATKAGITAGNALIATHGRRAFPGSCPSADALLAAADADLVPVGRAFLDAMYLTLVAKPAKPSYPGPPWCADCDRKPTADRGVVFHHGQVVHIGRFTVAPGRLDEAGAVGDAQVDVNGDSLTHDDARALAAALLRAADVAEGR